MHNSWFRLHPWRTGLLVLACLAAGYFAYVCLPHGYLQLEQLESRLEQLTPQGARIDQVRAGLLHEGIKYREWMQESAAPLLSDGSAVRISANPGEQGEQLNIILVFDGQNRLIRRYIGRFHMCP
jgi:hypothetical protein